MTDTRREGSLEAPTRHPLDWQSDAFYDEVPLFEELDAELPLPTKMLLAFGLAFELGCNVEHVALDAGDIDNFVVHDIERRITLALEMVRARDQHHLDDYLADQSHCGARYNAWQNRCP